MRSLDETFAESCPFSLGCRGANGAGELEEPLLRELAEATITDEGEVAPPSGPEVIARVDSSSKLGEGREGDLWLDTSRIHLFDPSSGERLSS